MKNHFEWFEFENAVAHDLNELSKTHDITEVHYAAASSSDWNVLAGGHTYVLVKALKIKEETKCSE